MPRGRGRTTVRTRLRRRPGRRGRRRSTEVAVAEAVVALEAVVRAEPAAAGGDAPRIGDVEREFAEHRFVLVAAVLLGEPDRVFPAADGQQRGQVVDAIALFDVVLLLLPEQATDEAQA